MHRFAKTLPLLLATLACGGGGQDRVVIQNKGSDTVVNVAQAWAEAYGMVNPSVAIAVTGGGSGTGISAMINGTVDIANASRSMSHEEIEAARERGVEPIEHTVGFDALAVFLHPDNPITGMTFSQIADIYAEGGTVENWSQMGITIPGCESGEVIRVSRQNNSGTYAYFKEVVLSDREFKLGSRDMNGSSEVVDLVAHTPCAIGYSGLAYAGPAVKMPCVSVDEAGACVAPSEATALDGTYPVARPLFMYTAGEAQGAVKEYLDWILSDEGQCIIQKAGYAPTHVVACG
jgi:phosphate transport system substrate-binding protein